MYWLRLVLLSVGLLYGQEEKLLLFPQSREAMELILDRAAMAAEKRIDIVILGEGAVRSTGSGDFPLGYGGQAHSDLALPNPAFFQFLDWIVKQAERRRITVAILPLHPGSELMRSNSREKVFDFGRYLGRRYLKAKKLIWLRLDEKPDGPLQALEEGIRQFDALHPFETRR
jgi:hypothetical protein